MNSFYTGLPIIYTRCSLSVRLHNLPKRVQR